MKRSMIFYDFEVTFVPGHLLYRFRKEMERCHNHFSMSSVHQVNILYDILKNVKEQWDNEKL